MPIRRSRPRYGLAEDLRPLRFPRYKQWTPSRRRRPVAPWLGYDRDWDSLSRDATDDRHEQRLQPAPPTLHTPKGRYEVFFQPGAKLSHVFGTHAHRLGAGTSPPHSAR